MISSTIELTAFKFQTNQALRCGATALCRHATPPIIEKVRSKGVAMRTYGVSVYYVYTRNQMDLGGAIRNECKDRAKGQILSSITRATSLKLERLANVH